MEDVSLRVLSADELPKRYRIVMHVEKSDLTIEETVKPLEA